jgi:site-specific DNA-methyltransferase (cytosine-N4-specific)
MFSIIGDTVLDPFLGTGTTVKVAMELKRNSIGYEIDESFKPVVESKIRPVHRRLQDSTKVELLRRGL